MKERGGEWKRLSNKRAQLERICEERLLRMRMEREGWEGTAVKEIE